MKKFNQISGLALAGALALIGATVSIAGENSNSEQVVQVSSEYSPDMGVLVMAHGGGEEWNANVEAVVAPLKDKYPIEIAFGMARVSTMRDAVKRLTDKGARRIAVVRMFISGSSFLKSTEYILGLRDDPPGGMAHGADKNTDKNDMSHAKMAMDSTVHTRDSKKKDHSSHGGGGMVMEPLEQIKTPATFVVNPNGVGTSPLVDEILIDRVGNLSKNPENESILIIAHGPGDDKRNERWLANMRDRAKALGKLGNFRDVHCETLREDWPEKRALAEKRLRQYVIDGAKNGGTVIVVPFRIGGFGPYRRVLEGLDFVSDARPFCPHKNLTRWIEQMAKESFAGLDES